MADASYHATTDLPDVARDRLRVTPPKGTARQIDCWRRQVVWFVEREARDCEREAKKLRALAARLESDRLAGKAPRGLDLRDAIDRADAIYPVSLLLGFHRDAYAKREHVEAALFAYMFRRTPSAKDTLAEATSIVQAAQRRAPQSDDLDDDLSDENEEDDS